jgi:uncharacterized iron-regulated membrane protein
LTLNCRHMHMTRHLSQPLDIPIAQSAAFNDFSKLLRRLHFYIGLFVGPFILIAAVSGTLFVLTPQIEIRLYQNQLQNTSIGPAHSLAEQVGVAIAYAGADARLFAIRPAKDAGWNSRIMFTTPGLGDSESRAIFVDPVTLQIKGDLRVYGTSGTLPFRTTLDYLHRNLLLGDIGRNYSELAASWLWIAALSGMYLWWQGRQRRPQRQRLNARRLHSLIGIWILIGLVFFSATGLTWSRWAGGNVDLLRTKMGWITPSVSMKLNENPSSVAGDEAMHHHAHGAMPMMKHVMPMLNLQHFDLVQSLARAGGIDAKELEIRPPRASNQAWMVREVDRSWPTQVDTVAVDPDRRIITSRADFATFPLIAKLIRWGVDAHMGVLFGVANQILMALFGIALSAMIVLGYVMWWRRQPSVGATLQTLSATWLELPGITCISVALLALLLGWAMPLMGISLVLFLAVDVLRYRLYCARMNA